MLYAIIAAVVLVVLIFLYMLSRVVVVPSNLTGLVAGSTRNGEIKIIRPGGRDFVLPIIQSIQYLPFTQNTIGFQVTAEDENKINVNVSAVAAVKVGDSDEQVRAAAKRFLGKPNTDQAIADSARNALIGSLRSIIGHMTITDLISDRDALQQNVFDDAKSVMANMGLEIDVLQISEITDAGGYIESLGVPEQQRVEKDARIARAHAEREAKDAEVTSRQQIAERERDLALRQAPAQGGDGPGPGRGRLLRPAGPRRQGAGDRHHRAGGRPGQGRPDRARARLHGAQARRRRPLPARAGGRGH